MSGADQLSGSRILIVEDDYFIAEDLERIVKGAGAELIGPFPRVEDAQEAWRGGQTVSAAVLDINVAGTMVYPLAEELTAARVPVIFATGYDAQSIPARFAAVPRLLKPIEPRTLLSLLARLATPA